MADKKGYLAALREKGWVESELSLAGWFFKLTDKGKSILGGRKDRAE